MSSRRNIGFVLLLFVFGSSNAQFRLPQVDIDIKGMFSGFDSNADNVDNTFSGSMQGAGHIQINQHIAIGGYYGQSFKGKIKYQENNGSSNGYDTKLLFYGGDIRFSAGRSVKWRPYLILTYGKLEFVENEPTGFNLALATTTMGANGGVMLRLGNNMYWNVVEAGVKKLTDKVYWINSDFMIEFKTGFTYNIRIKNK